MSITFLPSTASRRATRVAPRLHHDSKGRGHGTVTRGPAASGFFSSQGQAGLDPALVTLVSRALGVFKGLACKVLFGLVPFFDVCRICGGLLDAECFLGAGTLKVGTA